jgi:hypothetical protein
MRHDLPILGLVFSAILAAGCAHLGPRTVVADRFDYSTTIADSWKKQTLLNIVKLRYMDLPVFVDVASIVSGYSMERSVNAGGQLSSSGAIQGNSLLLGGAARFTDRPTITYVPLTGEKFLHGLMAPIDPKNIFFMLQSGYAADFVLGLTVEGLNGLGNRSIAGGVVREAEADFLRVLGLIRDIQTAGALGMRVEEDKVKGTTAVLFFRRDDVPAEVVEKINEARRLLKLPSDQQKYVLTYSPMRGSTNELAVNSRSMLQVMSAFASYVDVPEQHLKEHRAAPSAESGLSDGRPGAVRIRSGKDSPPEAFASVPYRGHWFWIEDSDWQTKRALTAIMFIFTLAESGGTDRLPLITIPAQ